MGIHGLLVALKGCTKEAHVSQYKGKRVAVDAFCWLHRAAYTCSRELCEGIYTTKHIDFCMGRVEMLQSHGIQPLLVFDGQYLPSKRNENEKRKAFRREQLRKARAHMAAGNASAAQECYQRAVEIGDSVVSDFIAALRKSKVQFVLAPYEADSQASYLNIKNYVHAVISEDSDILVYSSPRVFTKMDRAGNGLEIEYKNIFRQTRPVNFSGLKHKQFVDACILAGCDYTEKIKGVGISRAVSLVKSAGSIQQVIKKLKLQGAEIPKDFELKVLKTRALFYHARVFDIETKEMVEMNPLESSAVLSELSGESLEFLGPKMDKSELLRHVGGMKKRPFEAIDDPDSLPLAFDEGSSIKEGAMVLSPQGPKLKRHYAFGRTMTCLKNANVPKYPSYLPISDSVKKPFVSPRNYSTQRDGFGEDATTQSYTAGGSHSTHQRLSKAKLSTGLALTGKKSKYFHSRCESESGHSHPGQSAIQQNREVEEGTSPLKIPVAGEPSERTDPFHNKENLSPSPHAIVLPSNGASTSQHTLMSSRGSSMYKKWKERSLKGDEQGNESSSSQCFEAGDRLRGDTCHQAAPTQGTASIPHTSLQVPESTKIAKRCLADFEAHISAFRLKK